MRFKLIYAFFQWKKRKGSNNVRQPPLSPWPDLNPCSLQELLVVMTVVSRSQSPGLSGVWPSQTPGTTAVRTASPESFEMGPHLSPIWHEAVNSSPIMPQPQKKMLLLWYNNQVSIFSMDLRLASSNCSLDFRKPLSTLSSTRTNCSASCSETRRVSRLSCSSRRPKPLPGSASPVSGLLSTWTQPKRTNFESFFGTDSETVTVKLWQWNCDSETVIEQTSTELASLFSELRLTWRSFPSGKPAELLKLGDRWDRSAGPAVGPMLVFPMPSTYRWWQADGTPWDPHAMLLCPEFLADSQSSRQPFSMASRSLKATIHKWSLLFGIVWSFGSNILLHALYPKANLIQMGIR